MSESVSGKSQDAGDSLPAACHSLHEALAKGDGDLASLLAENLAQQKHQLDFSALRSEKYVRVKICLEHRAYIEEFEATIDRTITFRTLKLLTFHNRGIPMELQNWFVKHSQPRDTDLLSELGIEEQSTLHCYFQTISPQKIPDVRSLYAPPLPPPTVTETLVASSDTPVSRNQSPPADTSNSASRLSAGRIERPVSENEEETDSGDEDEDDDNEEDLRTAIQLSLSLTEQSASPSNGWICDKCTSCNTPGFARCCVCAQGERPANFRVPDNYVMSPEEQQAARRDEYNEFLQLSISHPSNQDYLIDDWQQSQQQYTDVNYRYIVDDDEEGEDVPDNQPVT